MDPFCCNLSSGLLSHNWIRQINWIKFKDVQYKTIISNFWFESMKRRTLCGPYQNPKIVVNLSTQLARKKEISNRIMVVFGPNPPTKYEQKISWISRFPEIQTNKLKNNSIQTYVVRKCHLKLFKQNLYFIHGFFYVLPYYLFVLITVYSSVVVRNPHPWLILTTTTHLHTNNDPKAKFLS